MVNINSDPPKSTRCLPAAVGLVFTAPIVAEFLLGNLPIKLLSALFVLAPFYGCGALLVREVTRRSGRGWPTIVLLALVFGIVEEAFTTQTLFNPDYMHLHLHLLEFGWIPALGIGAWWTIFVLALHTVWSISVPIALIESTVPRRASTPWLGNWGLAATAVLYLAGAAANTAIGFHNDHFIAAPAQLAVSAVIAVLLVVVALRLPAPGSPIASSGPAQSVASPWLFGLISLVSGSAILVVPSRWGWGAAAIILALELGVAAIVLSLSRRSGWSPAHKLALAAGAALSYAWHAFFEKPVLGGSGLDVRIGNAIFALAAVLLIAFAAVRLRSTPQTTNPRVATP